MVIQSRKRWQVASFTLMACVTLVQCGRIPWTQQPIQHAVNPGCVIKEGAPQIFVDLCSLERGELNGDRVVSIVHLGDSHIAADTITRTVRRHLQNIWGNAGRGLVSPPGSFEGMSADGMDMSHSGDWKFHDSVRDRGLPFGISGIVAEAQGPGAELNITSTNGTDVARVVLAPTATAQGAVVIRSDLVEHVMRSPTKSAVRVSLPVGSKSSLTVRSWSEAPIRVTSIGFLRQNPGIRYYNFGIPSATVDTMSHWDINQVYSELVGIDPSMVVLAFGTNDGFNNSLNLERWNKRVEQILILLRRMLPTATILLIGPPDGARRITRTNDSEPNSAAADECVVLSEEQKTNYASMYSNQDDVLTSWHTPPNLARVRNSLYDLSKEDDNFMYWDASSVTGSVCGIHRWSRLDPPLAWSDHVHVSRNGAIRLGEAFTLWLVDQYRDWLKLTDSPLG